MSGATIEEMKRLSFTGAEAQIYVYLLQYPHATSYEVSKGTGLPRVYCSTLQRSFIVTLLGSQPISLPPNLH